MTKVIEISDEAEPLPKGYDFSPPEPEIDPDKPIFDRGDSARKEPLTLAELEAAVIPAFQAQQRKYKPKPLKYESPEDYDARVREEHRVEDARYYQGRPRSTGSETQRRSVNRLGRLVGEHGAHKIQGAYGKLKDDVPDAPVPTYMPAPEQTAGYCLECNKTIPLRGPRRMRPDAKFCSEAHSKAFRRREAQRHEFNKAFKDYWETAAGKAEAILQADARHVAVVEMQKSAARAGIVAEFFATSAGVMARADTPLPPVRFKVLKTIDGARSWTYRYQPFEVNVSDVPEIGATLYAFTLPVPPDHIGRMISLEVTFLGDPGISWECNGWPTPEQEASEAHEKAEAEALSQEWVAEVGRRNARWDAAKAERIARGDLTGTTSAREAHAKDRMKSLLARPDHDVIIAEFEEAKDWYGLREFYAAKWDAYVRVTPNKPKPTAVRDRAGTSRRRRERHRASLPALVRNPNALKPQLALVRDKSN
jgi:hypothetical protein